jgi:thiol-disulfide isomerase/thioredoxin
VRAAAAAVLCLLLPAGCAAVQPGAGTTPAATAAVDLVAARRAAGIPDCPAATSAAPVAGGLPALTLDCLGGDAGLDLASLRGPLLVNYWAQWCLPCRQEAPHLAGLAKDRPELDVLGVDYGDPQPGLAIEFAQLAGWTHPHLEDPERLSAGPVGVPGIPFSLLLDEHGRVVARHAGQFDTRAELLAWIDEGLRG